MSSVHNSIRFVFLASMLLVYAFVFVPSTVSAATYTWDGGGATNNWSDCDNWSTNICPGASDIATFDATSVKDATIDGSFAGSVVGVDINAGYTGVITQERNLIVGSSNFDQAAGTWRQATSSLDINGDLILSGGTFTAATGTNYILYNLTRTGGTVVSSSSRDTRFDGSSTANDSTVSCSGDLGFLISPAKTNSGADFTLGAGCNATTTGVIVSTGQVIVNGQLHFSGIADINNSLTINGTVSLGGDLYLENNLTQSGTFNPNGYVIIFNGNSTSDDTILSCSGELETTIALSKTDSGADFTLGAGCQATTTAASSVSGAMTVQGTMYLTGTTDMNGVFLNTGTTHLGGNVTASKNFNQSGALITNGHIVTFDGSGSADDTLLSCSGEFGAEISITKSSSGADFTLGAGCQATTTGAISTPSLVTIQGTMYFAGTVDLNNQGTSFINSGTTKLGGGNMFVRGNITQSGTFISNSYRVVADGSSGVDGTIISCTGAFGAPFQFAKTSSGEVEIGAGCEVTTDTNNTTSGPVIVGGVLQLDSYDLSASSLTINSSGRLILFGNQTLTSPTISENATIEFNGTSTYTTLNTGYDFENVEFSNGTYTLSADMTVEDNLTTNGSIVTLSGTTTFDGADQTITGTSTFGRFVKQVSGSATNTLTFGANQTQTIVSALVFEGASSTAPLVLVSSVPGTLWGVIAPSADSAQYVIVTDSNNTGQRIGCYIGCINGGNNTGWIFEAGLWNSTDWTRFDILTIDATQIDDDLTNFPVYVDLSDLSAQFWATTPSASSTVGTDIRVTNSSDIELPRELVFASSTLQTGELHFRADVISSTTDTVFKIWYNGTTTGDYARTATYGSENVWTNNFEAVFHLQEEGNNDGDGYLDSTSNANHGSGTSMTAASDVNGKLGKAQDFDGTSDLITIGQGNLPSGTAARTLSLWAKSDITTAGLRAAAGYGNPAFGQAMFIARNGTTILGGGYFGDDIASASFWDATNPKHTALTFTGTAAELYGNGASIAGPTSKGWNLTKNVAAIGQQVNNDQRWDGWVDEVRISSVARSAEWIAAEYRNQSTTTSFYSIQPGQILLSGTILEPNQTTAFASAKNLLVVTGTSTPSLTSVVSATDGTYNLLINTDFLNTTTTLTIFLDGETEKAVTVLKLGSETADVSGVDLYQDHVILRHESTPAAPTTTFIWTGDFDFYDADDDADLRFRASSTNAIEALTVFKDTKLYIWDNTKFIPGGGVTIRGNGSSTSAVDGSLELASGASYIGGSDDLSLAGSLISATSSHFFPHASGTRFTATTTGKIIGSTLTPNEAEYGHTNAGDMRFVGVGGSWMWGATATVTDFYIATGTVYQNANHLTTSGDFTQLGSLVTSGATTHQFGGAEWGATIGSSTLSYTGSTTFATYRGNRNITFKPDGTKVYRLYDATFDGVYQHTLSTPWDLSTASYDGQVDFGSGGQGFATQPRDIYFRPDGRVLFYLDRDTTLAMAKLSTPWEVSTALVVATTTVTNELTLPQGFDFKPDGTRMYLVGDTGDLVVQYDLVTPWDIRTASATKSYDMGAQMGLPTDVAFSHDGSVMYVTDDDLIFIYDLATPWDVGSVTFRSQYYFQYRLDGNPNAFGFYLTPDQQRMFLIDRDYEFDVMEYEIMPTALSIIGDVTGDNALGNVTFAGDAMKTLMANASTSDFVVAAGSGTTTIPAGVKLTVGGDFTQNSDTYYGAYADYYFGSSSASAVQSISGGLTGEQALGDVTMSGSSTKIILSNVSTIDFTVVIGSGTTTIPAGIKLTVGGDFTQNSDTFQGAYAGYSFEGTEGYVVSSSSIASIESMPSAPTSAGIGFSADGRYLYTLSITDSLQQHQLTTPFDISSYTTIDTIDLSAGDNEADFDFSPDGRRFYLIYRATPDYIEQYQLEIPWDLSTRQFVSSSSAISAYDDNSDDVVFKHDGSAMYILGSQGDRVDQYTLMTPWDIQTAVYVGTQPSSVIGEPEGFDISPDGQWIVLTGFGNSGVHLAYLSTPWDVTSSSWVSSIDFGLTNANEVEYIPGARLAVADQGSGINLHQLDFDSQSISGTLTGEQALGDVTMTGSSTKTLISNASTTDFTIATSSGTTTIPAGIKLTVGGDFTQNSSNFSGAYVDYIFNSNRGWNVGVANSTLYDTYNTGQNNPIGLFISPDGTYVYTITDVGLVDTEILSTPWDLKTASDGPGIDISGIGNNHSIWLSPNGERVFYLGLTADVVYQRDLSTPWDITTVGAEVIGRDISAQAGSSYSLTFSADGVRMYVGDVDTIFSYTLTIPWDARTAQYDGKTLDLSGELTWNRGVVFRPDGRMLFVNDRDSQTVFVYTLSAPWEINTASYSGYSAAGARSGLIFKPDGSTYFSLDWNTDGPHQFVLDTLASQSISGTLTGEQALGNVTMTGSSTKTLISNASTTDFTIATSSGTTTIPAGIKLTVGGDFTQNGSIDSEAADFIFTSRAVEPDSSLRTVSSVSVQSDQSLPYAIYFRPDGKRMYVGGDDPDQITQYNLATAWDPSSKGVGTSLDTIAVKGLDFSPDGSLMFVFANNVTHKYELYTPWDVTTAVLTETSTDISDDSSGEGIYFKPDGSEVFIIDQGVDRVRRFILQKPWQLSGATISTLYSVASYETTPHDLYFTRDGRYMYITGANSDQISVHVLSTPWAINTAGARTVLATTGSDARFDGLYVSPDGSRVFVTNHFFGSDTVVSYSRDFGSQTISGTFTGSSTLGNVTINGPATTTFSTDASVADLILNAGTTTLPSGTLTIAGDFTNSAVFEHSSGTMVFAATNTQQTATGTLNGTGAYNRFNNLTVTNTSQNGTTSQSLILGSETNIAGTFELIASTSVQFPAGATTTAFAIDFAGAAGSPVWLRSSAPGTQWHFDVQNQTQVLYTNVMDSDACGSPEDIVANAGIDSGNNTCWTFLETVPTLTIADHDAGQVNDVFSFKNETDATFFAFNLTPTSTASVNITSIAFSLSGVDDLTTSQLINLELYRDMNNNGLLDVGVDVAVGGAGTLALDSRYGTVNFGTSFLSTTSQNYIVIGDTNALDPKSSVTINLRPQDIETSTVVVVEGSVQKAQHTRRPSRGGGGAIGGDAPPGREVVTGGSEDGGDEIEEPAEDGNLIGNAVGFNPPSSTGAPNNEFTNPANAYVSDGTYVTLVANGDLQDYADFNFSIPGGNTIDGIAVKIEASGSGSASSTIGAFLSYNAGTNVTAEKTSGLLATSTETLIQLGGPSDEWGRSWTPGEFSNANFRLRLIFNEFTAADTANIDAIQVRVYHSATGGGAGGGGAI